MSILIKGMEMPECCEVCPCYDWKEDICRITDSPNDFSDTRVSDCPLVEVPTPHGKLIDADELKKNMRNYYPSIDHLCCSQHVVTKRDIDCAPTIIEAEVSE